ncbi:MAG: ABC transporter ATP-binding protein [Maricaulis sp.]|uniref:ABC transporter ATP-binding protein n=1 Tax=Maricaulis sp. TaxID=1486257 RepID=UPI0026155F24|nr:ABC transporter ATP-binding protein [Maricaulis sp.]MDM7983836.1 ABC transporter ATP-binding protein [Maricaulis sp.]
MSEQGRTSTGALGKRLWRDWVWKRPGLFLLGTLFAAITAGAAASYAGVIAWTFDMLDQRDPGIFPAAPLAIIALATLRSLSLYAQTVQTNKLALHVMQDMQNAMFAKLIQADFARLQSESVGSVVSRFTNEITLLRETLVRLANNLVRDILTVFGTIGWMLYLDWTLTAMILVVYPIAFYPVVRIGQKLRKTSADAQSQMGAVTGQLEESFSGARMIKTYGLESYETQRADRSFGDRLRFLLRITENKARVDPILEIVGGLAMAGLVAFAGWRLINGETSLGNLMGILTGLGIMSPPIRAIGTLNAVVQEGFAVLDRVFAVLDEKPAVAGALDAPSLNVEQGAVELNAVSFNYPDGTPALKDVSLKADSGKTIALVGASGSGKSTIINLIPRLYDVSAGVLAIDGQDIRSVSLASLRQSMALVSQDVTLFDDSVRANIAFGRLDASDAEIEAAARAADAHDFIMELPEGYASPVGPRGGNLSGGQRQRISIARAILKDAPILLLDEATSALDTQSEKRVQGALDRLSEGRTTIVIAHRLSTVRNADWIYVMQDGEICEQGQHEALVAQGGVYARLSEMQFGDEPG